MTENWFWEGTGGALIGTLGAACVALVAIYLTRRHERALVREAPSLRAAHECWVQLVRWADQAEHQVINDPPGSFAGKPWPQVDSTARELDGIAQKLDFSRSLIVDRPSWEALGKLADDLRTVHGPVLRSAIDARHINETRAALVELRKAFEDAAKALSDYLNERP